MDGLVDLIATQDENGDIEVTPGSETQYFSVPLLALADPHFLRILDGTIVVTAKNGTWRYRIEAIEEINGSGAYSVRGRLVYPALDGPSTRGYFAEPAWFATCCECGRPFDLCVRPAENRTQCLADGRTMCIPCQDERGIVEYRAE